MDLPLPRGQQRASRLPPAPGSAARIMASLPLRGKGESGSPKDRASCQHRGISVLSHAGTNRASKPNPFNKQLVGNYIYIIVKGLTANPPGQSH